MKRLLLFLLAFTATTLAQDLRILTFNIRYDHPGDGPDKWENRREVVAKFIAENADVAGLQEVKPNQRLWLVEKLPDFALVGIGRRPNDEDESVPIAYRKDRFEHLASGTFWLSDKPGEPGSTSFGNQLPRICTWAKLRDRTAADEKNAVLWFYNVHLDHQSGPAREKGLALSLDRLAAREGNERAVLVGDFNSTQEGAPLKAALAREKPAITTTFLALGQNPDGTFHGFTGKPGASAIDFILIEKDRWTVKSGGILKPTYPGIDNTPRQISDHFPVTATLAPK